MALVDKKAQTAALLTNVYVVVFNGPPRSGKDTAAKWLLHHVGDRCSNIRVMFDRFSMPLKASVASWAGTEITDEGDCYLEAVKDEEVPELLGSTYRRQQINLFHYLAAKFGDDVLGKFLVQRILKRQQESLETDRPVVYLIPDGGRGPEVEYLRDHLPVGHLLIIQLEADGCTFEKDIRGYVNIEGVAMTRVVNYKDGVQLFVPRVYGRIAEWYNKLRTH